MREIADALKPIHVAASDQENDGMAGAALLAGQHVFLNGTVISRNDETVLLDYNGAIYIIDWDYDDSGLHRTYIVKPSDNVLKFTLTNCLVTNGIFYEFNAGLVEGKPLELRLFIHTIGSRENGVNRSIAYTLAYAGGGKK